MKATFFDSDVENVPAIAGALEQLRKSDVEGRGAIYTKRIVVDFILDLAGYTIDTDLISARLLEPSFGEGEFLVASVERLIEYYFSIGGLPEDAGERLCDSVQGVELHQESFRKVQEKLWTLLQSHGIPAVTASLLVSKWLICGDYLITPLASNYTHVVGNPPYVRQERIPEALLTEYRSRYDTIFDRADLYVPFIEKSLSLLDSQGVLAFICSDRWMKNRYGGPLRSMVTRDFHLRYYVDMVGTLAFEGEVMAYPAIFVIGRNAIHSTRLARRPGLNRDNLCMLAKGLKDGMSMQGQVEELPDSLLTGSEPWILEKFLAVQLMRSMERRLPTVEGAGCTVGIGVATGADKVFIRPIDEFDVEESRRLPLALARDIKDGRLFWSGSAVLNPFREEGGLVDLEHFPKFANYIHRHEDSIRSRHVSQKNPRSWFKTIDRIRPELSKRPKLLIPDIKGQATVVYDEGSFYPHHNLYYVESSEWNLRALQTVLRSAVAEYFVSMYCVKMKGGFLRFQAQYIRRIRIPFWPDVSVRLREQLVSSAEAPLEICNKLVFELYNLSEKDIAIVRSVVGAVENS